MGNRMIFEEIIRLTHAGVPFALATVVDSKGSSPRKAGAKMIVREDGTILGTVGGGRVEAETIQAAAAAIRSGNSALLPFVLTEEHHFVCGGSMQIYVEPFGVVPRLVIFGGGHVGKAVAGVAGECGFHITVVDDRADIANRDNLPGADEILCVKEEEAFRRIPVTAETCIVIATRGHDLDFQAVRGALGTPAGFIGLVGSRRKYQVLVKTLEREGFTADERNRIISPVGLPIGAETPAEIAVSIVGQLIQGRRFHAAGVGGSSGGRPIGADGEVQTTSSS